MTVPDPALVVLIGPSWSRKPTWATQHYRATEIASPDALLAVVGSGEHGLDASRDTFRLLDGNFAAGSARCVDALGLDGIPWSGYLDATRAAGMPAVGDRHAGPMLVASDS